MKKIVFAAIGVAFCGSALAQSAVVSLGGTTASNGSEISTVSQSAGQVGYSSRKNAFAIISEGVQQNLTVVPTTNIDGAEPLAIQLKVYPNPTADFLTIQTADFPKSGKLKYTVFTAGGQTAAEGDCDGQTTRVPVKQYASGIYLLKITDGKAERNFRIIKP